MNNTPYLAVACLLVTSLHSMQRSEDADATACAALEATNHHFSLIMAQERLHTPQTNALMCADENLADLAAYSTAIAGSIASVNEHIGTRVPAVARDTKNRLILAVTCLFDRAQRSATKAHADLEAPADLAMFFKHMHKAHRRTQRTCTALARLDVTRRDWLDQTIEGATRALPDLHLAEGIATDTKNLVVSAVTAGTAWMRERNSADLRAHKDSALRAIIESYTQPDPADSARPAAEPLTIARLADKGHLCCTIAEYAWPILKQILGELRGFDPQILKEALLAPIHAQKTTAAACLVAPWLDNAAGRWVLKKCGQSPALVSATSAYLNGVCALKTHLVATNNCTAQEFDVSFTRFVNEYIATPAAKQFLEPASLTDVCQKGDTLINRLPTARTVLTTLATYSRETQAEVEAFLTFLKTIGQHGVRDIVLFSA